MNKSPITWSRRKFLTAVSVASAGTAIAMSPLVAWATYDVDPRVAAIVAGTIGVDTHNHIDVPIIASEVPGPNIDLAGEMKRSGFSAICMTAALDYQKLTNPGEAYERFLNAITSMDRQLKDNGMKRALNFAGLRAAHKRHQPVVIQSLEGGHFLEGKLERLGVAYGRGLRHLTLLHDSDASIPLGDVYTNQPRFGGLTPFGAAVIKECNRLGIMIDLTHASNDMVAAALKITTQPVMITHTGLDTRTGQNENMARMMRPRLISKEEAKIVAGAGGIIGVWTHLSDSALEYAQNIRALAEVVGTEHVCIGTDTKLTPSYRSPNAPQGGFGPGPGNQGGKPGGGNGDHGDGPPNPKPQNGPGGGSNQPRAGERTNLAWQGQQVGFYYAVVDAMLKTGFTPDEIGKIGGGNFCRVFDAATAGH